MNRVLCRVMFAMAIALSALLACCGALYLRAGSDGVKQPFHRLDERFFGERLMGTWAALTTSEDWSQARSLSRPQDYAWLRGYRSWIAVAHALGESTGPAPNTIAALERSRTSGFSLFEVDLSLVDGVLRCQHDPERFAPPRADDCRFDSLVSALPRDNAWLVLDIKTDFATTGAKIVQELRRSGRARQVIFQLYQPSHLALFDEWQKSVDLPGPIVTTYLAHRAVNDIAAETARAGVRAFTLPTWRLPGFSHRPAQLEVFVHPVHDCETLRDARASGVRGIYTLNSLHCADLPPIIDN